MKARIADDLNRTDLDTQIGKAINRAIAHYAKSFRFYFNETTSTFVTVAGTFGYTTATIPTDIAEIDLAQITIASNHIVPLIPRTWDYINQVNTTSSQGTPEDYAYYKGSIYLYPVPNAVYTITLSYSKTYTDLSLAADTNDFTTNAEDLIEARAEWWVLTRILKDYEGGQIAKAEEQEALTALVKETNRWQSTGKVRPTDF